MGRRDRAGGQDHIDLQRQAEKKRRAAHKRQQKQLTKQLKTKINDDDATVAALEAELKKLDSFRSLTKEQRTLKESLIERLEAAKELERMQKVFEDERKQRHARGDYSENDDDEYDSSGFDDDDDDNSNNKVGPTAPSNSAASRVETIDETDPWAQVFMLQEQEDAENKKKNEKNNNNNNNATTMVMNFVPISAMTGGGGAKKHNNDNDINVKDDQKKDDEDDEVNDFLASLEEDE